MLTTIFRAYHRYPQLWQKKMNKLLCICILNSTFISTSITLIYFLLFNDKKRANVNIAWTKPTCGGLKKNN